MRNGSPGLVTGSSGRRGFGVGSVNQIRSAHRAPRFGAIRSSTAKDARTGHGAENIRTIVLFCGRATTWVMVFLSWLDGGDGGLVSDRATLVEQILERPAGASLGPCSSPSSRVMWWLASMMPWKSWENCSGSASDRNCPSLTPVRKMVATMSNRSRWSAHQTLTHGSGLIVKLRGGGDERAATGHRVPAQPVLEQSPHPRFPPRRPHSRPGHGVLEADPGMLQHRQLQRLLGPEVGEQAALGELGLLGERTDRQPAEADATGDVDRLVEHR